MTKNEANAASLLKLIAKHNGDVRAALDRPERRKLNAEFMCWNMQNMKPEQKRRFFS